MSVAAWDTQYDRLLYLTAINNQKQKQKKTLQTVMYRRNANSTFNV